MKKMYEEVKTALKKLQEGNGKKYANRNRTEKQQSTKREIESVEY